MKTITKTQLKEYIAKLVAEQVKSLSPEAQKALELSHQAKLNKDAQKKRAAAKASMRGISVEGNDPTLGEQSSWHRDQNGELADLYKTKYRVNFGQGQVSNTFPTRKEAEYELTFHDEPNAFIQFKDLDTGEWFDVRHLKEQLSQDEFYARKWDDEEEEELEREEEEQEQRRIEQSRKSKMKEQRIEGDKRQSDEVDFFDTSELQDYQDDLNNDYLGFDDGDIGDSYQGTGESWDDGHVPGSYRYVR